MKKIKLITCIVETLAVNLRLTRGPIIGPNREEPILHGCHVLIPLWDCSVSVDQKFGAQEASRSKHNATHNIYQDENKQFKWKLLFYLYAWHFWSCLLSAFALPPPSSFLCRPCLSLFFVPSLENCPELVQTTMKFPLLRAATLGAVWSDVLYWLIWNWGPKGVRIPKLREYRRPKTPSKSKNNVNATNSHPFLTHSCDASCATQANAQMYSLDKQVHYTHKKNFSPALCTWTITILGITAFPHN